MATSKVPLVPGTKTLARGSVVIGNASGEPSALAIGSNTYVLKSDGTDISWGADAAGTITAFTNGVDNRVVTATSATALNGETNFIYNGTIVGCGADGANADLGAGLHVKVNDSGASDAWGGANEIVIEDNADSGMSILSGTSGVGRVVFGDSGDVDTGRVQYDHANDTLDFYTLGVERLHIQSDGSINCGTNGGDYNLYAGAPSDATFAARFDGTGTGTSTVIQFVNGYGQVGSISLSGAATAFNTSSDYRLKENINYDFDATTRLKQLKPARFNFKTDADKTVDGFIAHEVSSIVPEAISGEKDAMKTEKYEVTPEVLDDEDNVVTKAVMGEREIINPQGIDQSKLVPLLVASLQEAITKIETLETKVTALENK